MEKKLDRFLHGGDYNPNQWPREIWDEDMKLFKKAHINSATINVFSWAKLQPAEDVYDFSELDDIVEMLSKENCDIVMATSTASMPAWLSRKYPEVQRTSYFGSHHRIGRRHNACPNSPIYQKYSRALAEQLAKRYAGNPHIVCWHVNNEYGGRCYCENCEKAFRQWLKKKYGTLENVNKAWNFSFWAHYVYDWDEIVVPNEQGVGRENGKDTAFAGVSIDYERFMSDSLLNNYILERDAIRKYDPDTPITTNLMATSKGTDYFKWGKEMDIVSWDNYPRLDTPWSETAMKHDLMRGLKNEPFMLMEQTPSQQNWQPYNTLKRPGQMRAQSYQSIAHGADTIQYFQLRRSVGGCEKFHGAVISHAGTSETRVFREVSQLGAELEKIGGEIIGSGNPAQVGVVFDWDTYWALEYTSGPSRDLTYVDQIHRYYEYFYNKNIPVHMVPVDADFSKYKIIVAPVLYMIKEGMQDALEAFVKNGGILVTTYMSGIVNESDNVHLGGYPGPLRKLAGVWVEEIDALLPNQSNSVIFKDQSEYSCSFLCDLMHLEGAEALGVYGSDFYANTPAAAKNAFGKGFTYYIGTQMEYAGFAKILDQAVQDAGVKPLIPESTPLEIACRQSDTCKYYFIMNFKDEVLKIPSFFAGHRDIITGETIEAGKKMAKYDVCIVSIPL